jgi:hypothetical protein
MSKVILAPSYAGKSYFADTLPGLFLDGDDIIRDTVGWPEGAWWEAPDAEALHEEHARAIRDFNDPRVALFNGNMDALVNEGVDIVAVWAPFTAQHFANFMKRRAEDAASGRPHSYDGVRDLVRSRSKMVTKAAKLGIPIVRSLSPEAALEIRKEVTNVADAQIHEHAS